MTNGVDNMADNDQVKKIFKFFSYEARNIISNILIHA